MIRLGFCLKGKVYELFNILKWIKVVIHLKYMSNIIKILKYPTAWDFVSITILSNCYQAIQFDFLTSGNIGRELVTHR